MEIYGVILAGGSGSRLWPLSRDLVPKHLVKIDDNHTFFQSTLLLTASLVGKNNIVISTNVKLVADLKTQILELEQAFQPQFLLEPVSKNTCPAIALAALSTLHKISRQHESDAVLFITPSDYSLAESKSFKTIFSQCVELAKSGKIVTLGVKPAGPNVGYGYIHAEKMKGFLGEHQVLHFIEKPQQEEAEKYVKLQDYFWNTGIYIAKVSTILAEIKKYKPSIYNVLSSTELFTPIDPHLYSQLEDISYDYAVMENTDQAVMVDLGTEFCDMGSWESIYNFSKKNEHRSVIKGNVIDLESQNSFIYSTGKLVTALGLNNITLVETEDALMVCDSSRTQEISKLYDRVKETGSETFKVRQTMYRPWGSYTVLHESDSFKVKILTIKSGAKLSLQLHYRRNEHWTVVSGTAQVTKGEDLYLLQQGESIDLPCNTKHSVENVGSVPLRIVEVQTGDYLGEDDIVRFQDIYGRV